MKMSVRTKLFVGIGISVILVFLVGLSSYLSLREVEDDFKWLNHTEEVIFTTKEIVGYVTEAEANQRGYLLRGNKEFSLQFLLSAKEVTAKNSVLYGLVSDNPDQAKNVDELARLVKAKMQTIADLIAIKDGTYLGENNDKSLGNQSRVLMNEIKAIGDKIIQVENELLAKRKEATQQAVSNSIFIIIGGTSLVFLIVLVLFLNITKAFNLQRLARRQVKQINLSLENAIEENKHTNWLLSGSVMMDEAMRGTQSVKERSHKIISEVAKFLEAEMGVIYLYNENSQKLVQIEGYAYSGKIGKEFNLGKGLVGQAAIEKKALIISDIPDNYIKIESGLGGTLPKAILVQPFYFQGELKGVLELAFLKEVDPKYLELLDKIISSIGTGINAAQARVQMQDLFDQTQQQAEELESQQEELRVNNEELLTKTELLQASEEELRVQQEELRQINAELEEKARMLENNNQVIEDAKDSLAIKMKELEQTSKYKSEFLANMSHELRTPLNSILILARILRDNKSNHLVEEEVKYANVIFKAGTDLLSLINDILDLSKIESGFIELNPENVRFSELKENLIQLFDKVANEKEISFNINLAQDLPDGIFIDLQRLEQIIKNLISNAFKFTPKDGRVDVDLYKENNRINIAVSDTGIGIPPEKQKLIFDAFRQADGSTSREYGGTGLGLSISRELSKLMNAEITLESTPGKGSKFIFSLKEIAESKENPPIVKVSPSVSYSIDEETTPNRPKPLLLIIEDDEFFNNLLKDYATNNGFESIQLYAGDNVEELVEQNMPNAILLDVMLPGADGWEVLRRIKANPKITHIPVHMMSAGDFTDKKAITQGANSFIKKPLENEQLDKIFKDYLSVNLNKSNRILLIEDQVVQSDAIKELFKEKNIEVVQAFSGEESLEKLANQSFDCIILDLNLPDISGEDLLEKIKSEEAFKNIPVIINTAMELGQERLQQILKYSNATVLKSVKSGERLIDEVNLFLHKIKETEKSPSKVNAKISGDLENKIVLLVDDDMRNVFALSTILDQQGLKVEIANDGIEALEKLEKLEKVDIVLMDIMMPRLDGYETMKRIRANHALQKLPIIALTAKAMKEDRDKCIEAGANDYITKPVDTDQLISLMKIWIS